MDSGTVRLGYTTGACAAGAAKGSVLYLRGIASEAITIDLPVGKSVTLPVVWQEKRSDGAYTAIEKDGGDDPDVTSGLLLVVRARWRERGIEIQGGEGVGRVTKPGLPIPVGFPAINPTPQWMIRNEVAKVCPAGFGVELTVSILGGEKVAQKTFNPRLGIVGGLSVLGTTGLVVPRSVEGFLGTIAAELSVLAHQDCSQVVLTFGNYGHQYARGRGFSDEVIVSCGNFLGFALEKVLTLGFEKVIIIGELGKLAKVAGGIFLTDSRIADARMEILASFAALFGVKQTTIARIFQASLTEEVLGYLEEEGVSLLEFGNFVAARTKKRVMEHTQGRVTVVVEVFSLKRGFLGRAE